MLVIVRLIYIFCKKLHLILSCKQSPISLYGMSGVRSISIPSTTRVTVNSSEQSLHSHQNGFSAAASAAVSVTQPSSTASAAQFTAQATWTGSNTLTYTQSMQPPLHNTYCEPSLLCSPQSLSFLSCHLLIDNISLSTISLSVNRDFLSMQQQV